MKKQEPRVKCNACGLTANACNHNFEERIKCVLPDCEGEFKLIKVTTNE